MRKPRKDAATARKVDIALIMRRFSGTDVARQYLRGAYVEAEVIERVLSGGAARSGMTPAPWPGPEAGPPGKQPAPRPADHCADHCADHSADHSADNPADYPAHQHPHYAGTGRRKDVASAAIVQAAIAVRDQLDAMRAENLLRREALPEEVIARVLAGTGPRRQLPPSLPANGTPAGGKD